MEDLLTGKKKNSKVCVSNSFNEKGTVSAWGI